MLEKKLLTKEEVEEINTTGFPGMMYYVGKLEWEAGFDPCSFHVKILDLN